ncbi:LysR family transcriptional regulator [Zavarzinia compransoris]|uniref:LysR family transcriptional regulator n=1 Tax=Zavarzinia marina TaxID=2911065 RepID=UPI001F3D7F08|nr:LysR family transcriptional regulator [Zavarzinia marina]MCF4166277.1 LysR family transcriptional regulator [Zavarzinia marina]
MSDSKLDLDAGLFRRVDLNLFRVFLEIAQAGGIGAAARRLNLQQPAVSVALQRLEGHLGHALCTRTSRGVTLTPAGQVVAHFAEELFREVQALPRALAAASGEVEGDLVIRAVSGVVSPEVDATLEAMARRHPRIRLNIDIAPRRIVLQALLKGTAEACLTFDSAPRADLHYEPLMREYQQIYCGRSHPLYGMRVADPARLSGERFVLMGSDEPDDVRNFRRRYGLGDNPAGIAENLSETIRLIRLGIGIGFLPTLIAEGVTPPDALWPLLPVADLPNYLMYLVTRPEAEQTLPAQLFLAEIRRRMAALGAPL